MDKQQEKPRRKFNKYVSKNLAKYNKLRAEKARERKQKQGNTMENEELVEGLAVISEVREEFDNLTVSNSIEEINISNKEDDPTEDNDGNEIEEMEIVEVEENDENEDDNNDGNEKEENQEDNERQILSGNRIVNAEHLIKETMKLTLAHVKICENGSQIKFVSEIRRGLFSYFKFHCEHCKKEYLINSQNTNDIEEINKRVVWGTVAAGHTYTPTNELMSILNIPLMDSKRFGVIERDMMDSWEARLIESMDEAGKEERAKAILYGDVDVDGIPFTAVYCDGGWSHRSYGHSYNADSGAAVIIGKNTGKILHLEVRNKDCSVCDSAEKRGEENTTHRCYKNWAGSSGAMESDIIVKGFKDSIKRHGLKYSILIGDGDSSVYAKIRRETPYDVEKVECKNHATKNFGSALRKMKKDVTINRQARDLLTGQIMIDLQKHVMELIKLNANGNVNDLIEDFGNAIEHCYDDHSACKQSYCSEVGNISKSKMGFVEQTQLYMFLSKKIDHLKSMAANLIANENTNPAEHYMSLLAKMNAGKRLNLARRHSFQMRAYLAGLRYNLGPMWQAQMWREIMETEPGEYFENCFKRNEIRIENKNAKRKAEKELVESQPRAIKKKKVEKKQTTTKSKDESYGINALKPALTDEEYEKEKEKVLESLTISNREEVNKIELETIGQFKNKKYVQYKKNRLTASNFGLICKRHSSTNCKGHLDKITNVTTCTTKYMRYGTEREEIARELYQNDNPHLKIRACGLVIDEENSHLAASPDGFIDEDGLIEIKCHLIVKERRLTLWEAVQEQLIKELEIVDERMQLRRNHDYYYQIQGQLNICRRDYCIFVVYTSSDDPLYLERFEKDEDLWKTMKEKLNKFYFNCMLPRCVDPQRPCLDENHHISNKGKGKGKGKGKKT